MGAQLTLQGRLLEMPARNTCGSGGQEEERDGAETGGFLIVPQCPDLYNGAPPSTMQNWQENK